MTVDLTTLSSLIGAALGGGGLLKLVQVVLSHRRAVNGDFSLRTAAARDNFQIVVKHLEDRIQHLEQSEKDCEERNRELEQKIRHLEARIEELILRSPWRELS